MKIFEGPKTLFFSIVFGGLMIGYLISFGNFERIFLIILTIFGYHFIKSTNQIKISRIFKFLMGMVMGMMLCSYGLFFLVPKDPIKKLPPAPDEKINTAVLLIFDGEAERYDLPILINNFTRDKKITDKLWMPYRLYSHKRAYEDGGTSRYNEICETIKKKLSKQLDGGYDIFISYINSPPYYQDVVEQDIFNQNYKKVIAVPVYLTQSPTYNIIVSELQSINLSYGNTRLKFSQPLWDSEKISKAIVEKINSNNKNARKSEVGIILIDRGADEKIDPNIINQEKSFMSTIKDQLMTAGYEERKISIGSIYPNLSEINNIIGKFQQYGVGKVSMIGLHDVLDKIEKQQKMSRIIDKIENHHDIECVYIKGWEDGDAVIDELEYRIRLIHVGKWEE